MVHVDGAPYFGRLHQLLSGLGPGDWVYLTDWRIDATRQLTGAGSELGPLLAALACRGVAVRGLLWRSHPALVRFNQDANRVLSTLVNRAGGSWWPTTAPTTPTAASPSSVASTWPAAVVTTPGISATPTRSGSTPATVGGRPGTTSSWSCAARPCWMSTSPSGSAGRTAPPATIATRCGPCGGGSATSPGAWGCCSGGCHRPRPAPMPCRCCAPIRPGTGGPRSRPTASAASPGPT